MKATTAHVAREAPAKQEASRSSPYVPPVPWPLFTAMIAVQRKCACGGGCPRCAYSQAIPPIVQKVLNSPGEPLGASTRSFMEPRFGHDFSRVQIHRDAFAALSAEVWSAQAYTLRNHVVFASGQYRPGTAQGDRLLAHELAHTVQQDAARTGKSGRMSPNDMEGEANWAVSQVLGGGSRPEMSHIPPQIAMSPQSNAEPRRKLDLTAPEFLPKKPGGLFNWRLPTKIRSARSMPGWKHASGRRRSRHTLTDTGSASTH